MSPDGLHYNQDCTCRSCKIIKKTNRSMTNDNTMTTPTVEEMTKIYKRAEQMVLDVYPYIRARLDNTNPEHIIPNVEELSDADFRDYWKALYNVQNEHAMSYDGWTTAHTIFERLGFIKKEVSQGHRTFVSYSYPKGEQYKCPSYEENGYIHDCNCGKCN